MQRDNQTNCLCGFFLGVKILGFRGSVEHIEDSRNGIFLGFLELFEKLDPLLMSHKTKVKIFQENGSRMAVHYLSLQHYLSQNEFIDAGGKLEQPKIISTERNAKYHSRSVYTTPNSAHIEQTTFLIRFVQNVDFAWEIQERFFAFC